MDEGHPDLMDDFLNGEREAFEAIFDRYYSLLYVFCMKMIDNEEISRDIIVESFTILFKRYKYFSTIKNIRAFLYITVRNKCLNYLKSINSLIKGYSKSSAQSNDIYDDQMEGIFISELHRTLNKIPHALEIYKLLYVRELTYYDIAKDLEITIETVKNVHQSIQDIFHKLVPPPKLPGSLFG